MLSANQLRRWFEYHCYEGEDSSDAELWHHTHQQVTILKQLEDVEPIGDGEPIKLYRVKFNDGFEYDVFEDELMDSPREFYRPDYAKEVRV
ncbi:unnamed protein product [marine sediment metagenome]|uniref:Uncharacterized protein n=1 Tax=marine sediment metagenome TaxID=412755 RepID=X1CR58_9ZZZZ